MFFDRINKVGIAGVSVLTGGGPGAQAWRVAAAAGAGGGAGAGSRRRAARLTARATLARGPSCPAAALAR